MKAENNKCDIEDQSGYTNIQVKVRCSTAELFYEACTANGEDPAGALTDASNGLQGATNGIKKQVV